LPSFITRPSVMSTLGAGFETKYGAPRREGPAKNSEERETVGKRRRGGERGKKGGLW